MQNQHLFAYLMDNIPDVIYFKDKEGRFILVNRAHARGLGLEPEEVVGKTDFDIHNKQKAAKMAQDDDYVIKTGKPIIDKVERATRPDGVDNFVSTTKIPFKDSRGKIAGLIGITRDITRRMQLVRLEKEKTAIERKLQAAEELRNLGSEFVSIASHELKTPLAIIQQLASLLCREIAGPVNCRQAEILKKMENNMGRLKKLIDDLLDVSKIEKGRFRLRYSLVNLNDLIKGSVDFFEKLARQKKLALNHDIPKKAVNTFIDADRITQVISNLIENAIKFTEEGGAVKIELKIFDTKFRIGIIDNGVGMSRQDLSQVFNRFVQAAKIQEGSRKGLGLGLSIAKELVEKHGGEIWAESEPGQGSKFYFTLPRLYTLDVLSGRLKEKIGDLLEKKIPWHLINLQIINYQEFKKRIKVGPQELIKNIKVIIWQVLKERKLAKKENFPFITGQSRRGMCAVVLPNFSAGNLDSLVEELKTKIRNYLMKQKADNVFITLGDIGYAKKNSLGQGSYLFEGGRVKEIYIGSEMRRAPRVPYRVKAAVWPDTGGEEKAETRDISSIGACLAVGKKLKTDSEIKVKIKLAKSKKYISFQGRVAWIREVKLKLNEIRDEFPYRVGVELLKISREQKRILSAEIKKS